MHDRFDDWGLHRNLWVNGGFMGSRREDMGLEPTLCARSRTLQHIASACLAMVMPSVCIDTVRVNAADIHGIVTTNDGFSVAGAVVSIVSASAPSAARAPTRYCAPDCGRHTISSADGTFAIRGVASELSCTIHIEAKD